MVVKSRVARFVVLGVALVAPALVWSGLAVPAASAAGCSEVSPPVAGGGWYARVRMATGAGRGDRAAARSRHDPAAPDPGRAGTGELRLPDFQPRAGGLAGAGDRPRRRHPRAARRR